MSDNNIKNSSNKIIDMLVGATLKRHGVELDGTRLSDEEKKHLKELIQELQESVNSLNEKNDDKK